jgi:hypothetical protein
VSRNAYWILSPHQACSLLGHTALLSGVLFHTFQVKLMEFIPFCLLLYKLHLFIWTQHRYTLTEIVPLHACYVFWLVLRPYSGLSVQKYYKEMCNKI